MKIRLFIGIASSIAIAAFLFASITPVSAQGKSKKGVVLSTVDIDEEYDVLGIVSSRTNGLKPEDVEKDLIKKAASMGADYVLGIQYYSHAGYLYGTGTAVRITEEAAP